MGVVPPKEAEAKIIVVFNHRIKGN
ncbi:hypothetical protein AGR1A_Lc100187 [Agrobacterium fabacearum CFBP 5771]|nr:hypothetical protein AGR1B_Lc10177 [Agrobacterium fabacearum S56]CVI20037.1 hypothetical protein AGR1A_Lc100187 [Agrobacterium fabacearum CFBP 5771]